MAQDGQDVDFYCGDDVQLIFTVVDEAGVALDFTGYTLQWILARKAGDSSILSKTIGSGITVSTNIVTVSLAHTETAPLRNAYWHQLVGTDSGGIVSTLSTGAATVNRRT